MNTVYKSKISILLLLDMIAVVISFLIAFAVRSSLLHEVFGNTYGLSTYILFLGCALVLYVIVFLCKSRPRLERQSVREIVLTTVEAQILFMAVYVMMFFVFHKVELVSRIFIGLFFGGNVVFCCIFRIIYHYVCVNRTMKMQEKDAADRNAPSDAAAENGVNGKRHIYILGSKSLGLYGGYESFVLNLLKEHADNKNIQYHVACKANGVGYMDLTKLEGAVSINEEEFTYCNAHCVLMKVPEKLGSAQAIYYDIHALKWACDHIEKNHIEKPIVYILASRIGPFEKKYAERIHDAGGLLYQNPDGHEDWRAKWSPLVRKYWKYSERMAVKRADLVICDSKSIENYIQDEYSAYHPNTTFIAYGSRIKPSSLSDDDAKYVSWLSNHNLRDRQFYTVVGRCVPENNFETIIREFMMSHTDKDLAIVTTHNPKMLKEIDQKVHFKHDKRIKFVGTVYDQELLTKIRENSYGYFHGHSVGGTNPSLLEALGATRLNLLYDVGFNREVALDAAVYWSLDEGNLARLIDTADTFSEEEIEEFGRKAKDRIISEYSWESICDKYAVCFGVK